MEVEVSYYPLVISHQSKSGEPLWPMCVVRVVCAVSKILKNESRSRVMEIKNGFSAHTSMEVNLHFDSLTNLARI